MARRGWSTANFLRYAGAVVSAYPFTIAGWFNGSIGSSAQMLAGQYDSAVAFNGTGQCRVGIAFGGGITASSSAGAIATSSTTYTTNTWAHACGVFNSATDRRAFLNGGGKGTSATSAAAGSFNRTSFGVGDGSAASSPFAPAGTGDLAEWAIWNVALSDADIAALGGNPISPFLIRPDTLVGYWEMLGAYSPETDRKSNTTVLSVQGTLTQSAHCRIFRPSISRARRFTTAAAAATSPFGWFDSRNFSTIAPVGTSLATYRPPLPQENFFPQSWAANARTATPRLFTALGFTAPPLPQENFFARAWQAAVTTPPLRTTTLGYAAPLLPQENFYPRNWGSSARVDISRLSTAHRYTAPLLPQETFYARSWQAPASTTVPRLKTSFAYVAPLLPQEGFLPRAWYVSTGTPPLPTTEFLVELLFAPDRVLEPPLPPGDWRPNISMRSGFRVSPENLVREWTGLLVERRELDPRHPQEFVKGRVDRQSVPNPKPEATDVFLTPNQVKASDL